MNSPFLLDNDNDHHHDDPGYFLYTSEVFTALFILGDVLTLGKYASKLFTMKQTKSRYPAISFLMHTAGGLLALLLGTLSLIAHQMGLTVLGCMAGQLHGLGVVVALGVFGFPMARYTQGYPGFNLVGYSLYSMTCIWIGSVCMTKHGATNPHNIWMSFITAHAFLTCRIIVGFFQSPLVNWKGDCSYSVATFHASTICLGIAFGQNGLFLGSLYGIMGVILDYAGIGILHATRGGGGGVTRTQKQQHVTQQVNRNHVCYRLVVRLPKTPKQR